MTDPRLIPANARVMANHLPPDNSGRQRVAPITMSVDTPLADLLRRPNGPRDRQLLLGDHVNVIERQDGFCFVQSRKDDYVGYVRDTALGPHITPSHVVTAPATQLYKEPDLKSPDLAGLSFGARISIDGTEKGFAHSAHGWIPQQHLHAVDHTFDDVVSVAELFLGTPYLWGGNSRAGLDCSGLVQAACLACGIACPGDSDQQEESLGSVLPDGTDPQRGDLMFWRGHVAWVVAPDQILHANAHTMSVAYEGLHAAVTRIQDAGDGPVTRHKRLA